LLLRLASLALTVLGGIPVNNSAYCNTFLRSVVYLSVVYKRLSSVVCHIRALCKNRFLDLDPI